MKIQYRHVLSLFFILSLGACSSGELPYPNLSTVPEKPIIRLTPQSQHDLKNDLQNDWHTAEIKHAEEKLREANQAEVQNATEQHAIAQPPTEQFSEETHVPIPKLDF